MAWDGWPVEGTNGRAARRESADALAARLAVGMTHDLRNYVLAIAGFTELAAKSLSPTHPAVEYLRAVDALVASAADALRQILAIAQCGTGARAAIDLGVDMQRVVSMLRRVLPPGVRVRCDAAEGIVADVAPSFVDLVVGNLVLNAADAMPSGGEIVVTLRTADAPHTRVRSAVIEVADEGVGVGPETLTRLFERGFTTKPRGCGLGLATVHDIVVAHGGAVEVETAAGRGATFRVVLPLSAG